MTALIPTQAYMLSPTVTVPAVQVALTSLSAMAIVRLNGEIVGSLPPSAGTAFHSLVFHPFRFAPLGSDNLIEIETNDGAGGAEGAGWAGACSDDPCASADINSDGYVDFVDLSILLSNFGFQNANHEDGEVDGGSDVDPADRSRLLTCYGSLVG